MKIKAIDDKEKATKIRKQIKENNGYCPCVPEYARNENTKCMCEDFLQSPAGTTCHCGLYIKVEE